MPVLGDHPLHLKKFSGLSILFKEFRELSFRQLSGRARFKRVNQLLFDLVHKEPSPAFLLAAVVDYMAKINDEGVLDNPYDISLFEFWLNHFSGATSEENEDIRAKIMGRKLPREEYQAFFPIGMGKNFYGTHFVCAHLSPDVDTTIASFWGWVDAFSARVGTAIHHWSLPGGPPQSPIILLFQQIFGQKAFEILARTYGSLSLTAIDLVTKKNLRKERGFTVISSLDHGKHEKAVILIDENDYFIGDWHSSDVEMVRQIVVLFKACLHWFENNFYTKLVNFFSRREVATSDIPDFLKGVFGITIINCEPAKDFSDKQKELLDLFLKKVLNLSNGIKSTFSDLSAILETQSVDELAQFQEELKALSRSDLFDKKGNLIEDRPKIFNQIERIIKKLENAMLKIRDYAERLDVVIQIKTNVLGNPSDYVLLRTDVEDIKSKIKNETFITVVIPEPNGKLFPVGVIWAGDLRKPHLGTVSLRDFSNPDEVRMASYLSIISVIDHHKSNLYTYSTPLALVADAQSCNVLIAEQDLAINEKFSASTNFDWQKKYFVHPDREFIEYLFFIHAILDDTDLLTKVSDRDVVVMAKLLNRLKTLQVGMPASIIDLEDIPRDSTFAKKAASRLLKNEDLFSLYKKTYALREKEVDEDLAACLHGNCSKLLADTKEQNGCCRVGQTKIFSTNLEAFKKGCLELQKRWLHKAQEITARNPEIDLHVHMISTIANAEEVHSGRLGDFTHQDQLWFWIPETQKAYDHLASFLSGFQSVLETIDGPITVELPKGHFQTLRAIFEHDLKRVEMIAGDQELPIATLRFKAGAINSRKSMITPYLPRSVA